MLVHLEFGDIGGPFCVRPRRLEMAIQPVGSHSPDLASIGTIPFRPQHTAEVLFSHELHDQFVVGLVAPLVQRQGDPPVPIAPFMLSADLADSLPFWNMFFGSGQTCGMVIIAASGKMCDLKQCGQRVSMP